MDISTASNSVIRHNAAVRYWISAAREQSRWFVQLRVAYRAEPHAHKRAKLWDEGNRCRNRRTPLMSEARRMRATLLARASAAVEA